MLLRLIFAGFLLSLGLAGAATRHALLIGVSKYPGLPGHDLEAPLHDVRALRAVLTAKWGFLAANIVTLENSAASKSAILQALDQLTARTRPGDQVFLYFSGHGTSAFDPGTRTLGLDPTTGGLIPADFRPGPLPDTLQRLIVARRDLRPRLQSLDAKAAQVFAIFDACYSGAAIKSIEGDLLTSREISLLTLTGSRSISEFGEPRLTGGSTPDDFDYPYRTVIYLSAAARSEKAFEISSRALASGLFSTLDGLPHGLLTNHLLRALHGEADTDLNGQITYRELHHFVYGAVMRQQTPQLLSPKGIQIVRAPVFEATRIAPASPAPNAAAPDSRPVTLRLHPSAADLAPRFANLPGVQLVSTPADLIVLRDRDRYTLAYTGGTLIERYLPQDLGRLTERIRREPDVRRLLAWRNPKPDFNLFLAAEPGNQAAYATGEQLSFALAPQAPAWLLLIDIDTSGHVTVLHPSAAPQLCPADSLCRSSSVRVGEPTGTELIKAFAFRSKPAALESWTGKNFAPESPLFRQFIAFLDAHRPQAASAHLQLFTTPRRPAEDPPHR